MSLVLCLSLLCLFCLVALGFFRPFFMRLSKDWGAAQLVRGAVCAWLAAVLALAAVGSARAQLASIDDVSDLESVSDPVYVFYGRGSCRGESIEIQIWNRGSQTWRDHPAHPVVPVESCQLEDAGVLLNELRWRCIDAPQDPEELDSGVRTRRR